MARARAALTLAMAASFTAAVVPVSAASASGTEATLAITVEGLGPGIHAALKVTGPDDYHHKVHGNVVLSVPRDGRYEMTASPVQDSGGTYWPVPTNFPHEWHTSVDVQPGAQASVEVGYLDYISNKVHVVPYGTTQSLMPEGRDEQLDLLRTPTDGVKNYTKHEILVSEPAPAVPAGYVVQVVKKDASPESDLEVLEVDGVTIEDAVPKADVDEQKHLETYSRTFESVHLGCDGSGGVDLLAHLQVKPTIRFKVKWARRRQDRSADIEATLTENATVQLRGGFGLDCHPPEIPLVSGVPLAPHGVVVFLIGPVPVAIKATLGVVAEGSMNVHGSLDAEVRQKAQVGFHLLYPSEPSPGYKFKRTFEVTKEPISPAVRASAEVGVVPQIHLRVYGLVGPTAGVRLYAKLEVERDRQSLQACARLQGHFALPGFKPRFKKITPWQSHPICRPSVHEPSG